MLYTVLPKLDALGTADPIDEIRNLRFPAAPHSERNAFIGAGYWFFCTNPAMLSRFPVKLVEQSAKYASRTGAVPNLSSPSMLSMIVYALLFNNARTTVSTSDLVISVGTSPSTPPTQLMKDAVAANISRVS